MKLDSRELDKQEEMRKLQEAECILLFSNCPDTTTDSDIQNRRRKTD